MRKKLIPFIVVVFLIQTLHVSALIDVTTGVSSPSKWVNVVPSSNAFDFLVDQQTGSGSVSQDLVGGTADFGGGSKNYGVFYIQFDDNGTVATTDDELAFRFRINNADGVHKDTFQYYVFVGLDFDLNGSVDLFTGMYNPDNNGSKSISIYSSDPNKSNTSPSTTGFGDKLFETTPVKNTNWSIMTTDDGSNFSGDADYFISFKLKLSDINGALSQIDPTWVMTTASPLRMFIGTASQANSYNQDMGGIQGLDTKSTVPWAQMGVFAPVVTPNGTPVEINLAPTAQDNDYTFAHGGSVKFKLSASDPDDDTIIYPLLTTDDLTDPTCGTLSGPDTDGYYTYTDNGTCFTANTLKFTVNDGVNTSNTATLTLTPINEAPTADDQDLNLDKEGSVKFKLTGSDPEDDTLTFPPLTTNDLTDPTCGTLSGPDSDGYYTYTDNGTCSTPNSLKFKVSDGKQDSLDGTITFTLNNQAPVAEDKNYDLVKGGSVKFKPSGSDPDNDPLTFPVQLSLTYPTCGTLSGPDQDGYYTYTDNGTCTQPNTILFTVTDGDKTSELGTLTFTPSDLPDTGVAGDLSALFFTGSAALWLLSRKKKVN